MDKHLSSQTSDKHHNTSAARANQDNYERDYWRLGQQVSTQVT